MKKKLYITIASVATVLASMVATSACFFMLYQPEEPKCLEEK